MKRVYVETSIVSYLTGRPSRNLLALAWREVTVEWWEQRRSQFEVFVSELVWEEAGRGDREAAQERLKRLEGIPLLATTASAVALAKKLIEEGALPAKAMGDALHISLCAVHQIDYLLTWNFRHLDNAELKPLVRAVCLSNSHPCPEICTPQELMGEMLDER